MSWLVGHGDGWGEPFGLRPQGARGQGGPLTPEQRGKQGFSVVGTVLARVPDNHDQVGLQASLALGLSRPSIQFNSILSRHSSPPSIVPPRPRPHIWESYCNDWFVKLQFMRSQAMKRSQPRSGPFLSSLHPARPSTSTSTLTSNIVRPSRSADLGEKAAQIWCADSDTRRTAGSHTDHICTVRTVHTSKTQFVPFLFSTFVGPFFLIRMPLEQRKCSAARSQHNAVLQCSSSASSAVTGSRISDHISWTSFPAPWWWGASYHHCNPLTSQVKHGKISPPDRTSGARAW